MCPESAVVIGVCAQHRVHAGMANGLGIRTAFSICGASRNDIDDLLIC